ncbi:MAG TPA: 2-oxo acid dehydrogenase subunit E2 [Baekduia sp.]|nr:2-oxo acid dehydrogenase subunit E2 [Baekduia sp.]
MSAKGAVETIEPTAAQRTVARRAAEAKATIPDFQVSVGLDRPEAELAPLVAAAGRALREHPSVNAAYVDAKFQRYERAHVGVVLPGAVPTILDADAKSVASIAQEIAAVREALDAGTLTASAQANATFTIASLAAAGVSAFTAIIAPGHAAALAVGATTLTLSADARIVTPTDAALFLQSVRAAL